ncbi:dephospho-CoA kinase [Salinibius halmophilus]|uniref:dephospho-CoA kinase n=1 Tax=Salinibius halmophilus TaxID=1853216 RepID=UPI000E671255|nr:dephospho-CoA kinase [Salinibius halmophilus]
MIVGLTGGIASGKSVASAELERLGCCIVDTDVLAREVVAAGSEGLARLVDCFGEQILTDERALNRPALRELIFADATVREQVESIVHPLVYQRMDELLATPTDAYHVLVSPLLVEKGQYKRCDRVLLIDVPESVQVERVMARDGVSEAQAQKTLSVQASRQQRLAVATDVIENTGSIGVLLDTLRAKHQQYLEMANEG